MTSDNSDPLLATASSLITLGVSEQDTNTELRDKVAHMLQHQVIQIGKDDFSGMEMLLTCQAQVLHRIFTQAAEKYANTALGEDNTRPYGAIALKAQSYCRMTVNTLRQMKGPKKSQKPRNELL